MSIPRKEKTWTVKAEGRIVHADPRPEGQIVADHLKHVIETLQANGWTVRSSGVIYYRDPGDEHVDRFPERWANMVRIQSTPSPGDTEGWIVFAEPPKADDDPAAG